MALREVGSKDKNLINKLAPHPLQTWEWGEFRKEWGNEVTRLGSFNKNKLENVFTIVSSPLPKSYFKIATLIKCENPSKNELNDLVAEAKKRNFILIKIEPWEPIEKISKSDSIARFKNAGAIPGKTLFTPTTFWLDITPSEDKILASFHKKTRYNIRLAQKKGVKIIEDNSDTAFERYLTLTRETVKRQGFYAHTERYHRLMWKHLHTNMVSAKKKPIARLLTAVYQKQIITTWILFQWKDFLYYPYGASTQEYKNVMANNLMLWEAIRLGKKEKLKTFDLWGREPGKGFTDFKQGYNPKVVEFLGTWDLVTSPLYWPWRVVDSARWLYLRGKSRFISPNF